MSVGDGGTMEVISLISVLLLWLVILLMFISEKSHGLCLAALSCSLLDFLSSHCCALSQCGSDAVFDLGNIWKCKEEV